MKSAHQPQAALHHLPTFLAVARNKSFSGAARELGISTSAVSQAVRQLEELLGVALLVRTTRVVTVTDAGARLVESADAPIRLALQALMSADEKPGEVAGRVRLCLSESALPFVLEPVIPVFRRRHPRVAIEVIVKDDVADFIAEGFDAAFAVSELIARDTVRLRLTKPFKYLVAGSPDYLAKHGTPRKPEDLLEHECINVRWPTDSLYAWEFERGRRKWRVPVRGNIVTNNARFYLAMAEQGLGLIYGAEIGLRERIQDGRLVALLEDYAPTEQGVFLCLPKREQQSPALRQFVNVAKELLPRR